LAGGTSNSVAAAVAPAASGAAALAATTSGTDPSPVAAVVAQIPDSALTLMPQVAPSPVPAVASAPPIAAPPPSAPVEVPGLGAQLARPLLGLRSAGDGNHVLTIRVTPENLGPVMVRAHVSGDSLRIELVAPTDQAREAIKAIMPDLRRDLSQAGGPTSLDLFSGGSGQGSTRDADVAPSRSEPGRDSPAGSALRETVPRARSSDSLLDVLA
jgi:flagellar hook-length control protein FliK